MNVTLSVDDQVLERARKLAATMGKSVNQMVREYLERLTSLDDAERDIEELRRLSIDSGGDPRGWRFDRDEIHERRE
jgi:hypothetical protein